MGTKRKRGSARVAPAVAIAEGGGDVDTHEPSASPIRAPRREAQVCGACGEKVPVKFLEYHLKLELDKLRTFDLNAESRKSSVDDRGRRQAAIRARKSLLTLAPHSRLSTVMTVNPANLENTLALVRRNRHERAARLREYGRASTAIVDGPSTLSQQCPICLTEVLGEEDVVQAHVDACLAHLQMREEQELEEHEHEGDGAEYEWAGQTRVRTTALAGFSGTGFHVLNHADGDVDVDLDIDGEEEAYGEAEFFENDIVANDAPLVASDAESEVSDEEGEHVERRTRRRTLRELMAEGSPEKASGSGRSTESPVEPRPSQTSAPAPTTSGFCRICLDPYDSPLVSTQCWHVHCRDCWMRSLGVSKLCPQCKCITLVGSLRRVYI